MASDVELVVAERQTGLVVVSAWLGMSLVVEAIREVVDRPADFEDRGFQSWGRIRPAEIRRILQPCYAGSPDETTLENWLSIYPPDDYIWCLTRDY